MAPRAAIRVNNAGAPPHPLVVSYSWPSVLAALQVFSGSKVFGGYIGIICGARFLQQDASNLRYGE